MVLLVGKHVDLSEEVLMGSLRVPVLALSACQSTIYISNVLAAVCRVQAKRIAYNAQCNPTDKYEVAKFMNELNINKSPEADNTGTNLLKAIAHVITDHLYIFITDPL